MSFYVALHNEVWSRVENVACNEIVVDKNTNLASLSANTETAKSLVCQPANETWEPDSRGPARHRDEAEAMVLLSFNRVVDPEPVMQALATPFRFGPSGSTDLPYLVRLSRVDQSWRPSQDSAPGTNLTLFLTVRKS